MASGRKAEKGLQYSLESPFHRKQYVTYGCNKLGKDKRRFKLFRKLTGYQTAKKHHLQSVRKIAMKSLRLL